tara:strand:- start:35101 stop:35625 length:525 start_codon:yes stop_codon:yes gene_type:complete
MSTEPQKLLFLDRDGTLIYDKHYMHDPKLVEFVPNCLLALKKFKERGYLFYVITNQSGIGRGFFNEEQMHSVHHKMDELFAKEGIKIEQYLHCPHAPEDNCDCRKPSPKLINLVLKDLNYDPKFSFMIGDKQSDVDAGLNAGIQGVLVKKDANSERPGEFLDLLEMYQSIYNKE